MREILLSFSIIFLSTLGVLAQSPAYITPNTVQENQALQVFISGNSQSQFEEWSVMAPAQLRLNDGSNLVTVANNYFNWQWNSSVGSYGFYTNLPAMTPGNYSLEVNNCWSSGGCWNTLNANAFTVTAIPPQITAINPQSAIQGQNLQVQVSGVNTNFQSWSWGSINFNQFSGTTFNSGTNHNGNNSVVFSNVTIPINADTGLYDVTVSTQIQSWMPVTSYTMNDGFRVYGNAYTIPNNISVNQGDTVAFFVAIPNNTHNICGCATNMWTTAFMLNFEALFPSYVGNYQWNNTLGAHGWEVEFIIPVGFPAGSHQLRFNESCYGYSGINGNSSGNIESNFTIAQGPPIITSISPSQGHPGQNLSVTISGVNTDFGNQWSGISTFRLQDASGQTIYGTSNSASGNYLYGNINIPITASYGSYDLDVWDYGINQWVTKDNAFEITLPSSYAMMPNTAEQGESLQVFISGSANSFMAFSCASNFSGGYVYGDLRLSNNNNIITIPNNVLNQVNQYGVNGFFTNLTVPNVPVGIYDLELNHCSGIDHYGYHNNCGNCWATVATNAFTVTQSPPKIFSITPNYAFPDDNLSVAISGLNMDFGNQWSGISTFRLQDANGQNIYGTSTSTLGDSLFGDIHIPTTASYGFYDLDVWDYGINQWVRKDSAFSIVANLCPMNSNAIWCDDFSNASRWNFSNSSIPSLNWSIEMDPNAIPVAALSPMASTSASNGYLFINSDATGSGDNNGTPVIVSAITANAIDLSVYPNVLLSFEHNYRWWKDTRGVRVSGDNGANWTEFEITNFSGYPNNQNSGNPEVTNIDISSVAGGKSQVLIEFYYDDNDIWAWYWAVDDVRIIEIPNNSLSISDAVYGGWWIGHQTTGGIGLDYTFNTMKQVTSNPYHFEALLHNDGLSTQNSRLHINVKDAIGTSVFRDSSASQTISIAMIDTFEVSNSFTPANTGIYYMEMWGESDLAITDTTYLSSIVSDTVYARDHGQVDGYWRVGRTCGGMVLGVDFDVYVTDDLTSVSAYVYGGAGGDVSIPGAEMFGALYEVDPQGDPIFLAQTDDYTIQQSDLDNWVSIPFNGAQTLAAGTSYMIAIGGYAHPLDTFSIAVSGEGQGATNHVQDNGCNIGSGGFGDWYWISSIPMIRMNLGTIASNIAENAFEGKLAVYPNPTKGIFTIDLKNTTADNYSIVVSDMLGKEVFASSSFVNGSFKENIDLSAFDKGVYLLSISNSNTSITEKIVIE